MKYSFLTLIISFLLISNSFAREVIKYKKHKFSLDVPRKWKVNKDLFGMPILIVGPMENGSRPTIGITPTGRKDIELIENDLRSQHEKYKDGRKRWLKDYNGTAKEFFPYEVVNWKHIKKVHSTGYTYNVTKTSHEERTYFFKCSGTLFHVKTLFNDVNIKNGRKKLSAVIESMKCM